MTGKLVRASAVGALAVALTLVLAACGGDGDSEGVASLGGQSTTTTGQGSAGKDAREAALDYARCMREHGVDIPDPVNGRLELRSERGDESKVREAQEACQHILQDAAPQIDEEQEAEMREAALEFAQCMREHGVDMPDPEFREGGGMLMRTPEGSENDPDFLEAQQACQPILNDALPDGATASGDES